MQFEAFYEDKTLGDPEFPVQMQIDECRENRQYFKWHWHEQIEMH